MKRLPMLVFAAALLVAAGGCDATDDEGTRVFTRDINFSMDDAVQNGNVASVQYEDFRDIHPNVVDYGTVLAFFREQGTWTAMPYTYAVDNPDIGAVDFTITLGYGYDDFFLEVFYEASTGAVDLLNQPDRVIRLVFIEDLGFGKTGIDLTDYEQVRSHYGLKD